MASRFQFPIRFLLVATVAVAAGVAVYRGEPAWLTASALNGLAVMLGKVFRSASNAGIRKLPPVFRF
ncbi:MAG TPA: hypothetical protein VHC22_22570 [Pirellulales bacterium]|nr:hypothetical protein [Pirellulales bacterium]